MAVKQFLVSALSVCLAATAFAGVVVDHDYSEESQFLEWTELQNVEPPNVWEHDPGTLRNMEGFVHLRDNDNTTAPSAQLLLGTSLPEGRVEMTWIGKKWNNSNIQFRAGDTVVCQFALHVSNDVITVNVNSGAAEIKEDFDGSIGDSGNSPHARTMIVTWIDNVMTVNWIQLDGQVQTFEGIGFLETASPDRIRIGAGWDSATGKEIWIDSLKVWDTVQESIAASAPVPANGDIDIVKIPTLSWLPVEGADERDVYMSMDLDAIAAADRDNPGDALKSRGQTELTYSVDEALAYETTYYWRVDEVNSVSNEIYKGAIWSFEVEPYVYPLAVASIEASSSLTDNDPNALIDGSGLDAEGKHDTDSTNMWLSDVSADGASIQCSFDQVYRLYDLTVWNYNGPMEGVFSSGFKDVTIEVSENGMDWTVLKDVVFEKGPGQSGYAANTYVMLDKVLAQHIKLVAKTSYGSSGIFGLSEVQFNYLPVKPRLVSPEDGLTDVDPIVVTELAWRNGREAVDSKVSLGTDMDAVVGGEAVVDTVQGITWDLAAANLVLGQTYYWMITDVNDAATPNAWDSEVRSFSTIEKIIVDDFETYNGNIDNNQAIYQTWSDGYMVNDNGSVVGDGDNAELITVRSGKYAMPLYYTNQGTVTDSYTWRNFEAPADDWGRMGVKYLVLYIHGDLESTPGQLYLEIAGKSVNYNGDASTLTTPAWTPWVVELAPLGIDVSKVDELLIGIRGSNKQGKLYVDDIMLVDEAPATPESIWIEAEAYDAISAPMEAGDDITASGGKFVQMAAGAPRDVNIPADDNDGVAKYNFTVGGGTYKVTCRTNCPDSGGQDSCFVRIQGATTNTTTKEGWINWNPLSEAKRNAWSWNDVINFDDGSQVVYFTMDAGSYTLEIARREEQAKIDVVEIVSVD